jgi:carbonic anhydrase/acetyltransferase-like protein (isoleucine patch superfamily)
MAVYRFGDDSPRLGAGAWVAESAQVIGRVALGARASVWYGSVLRGDSEWITLGDDCNVQDACVLHTDPGFPLVLGRGVSIGHQAMLHGCTVGEGSLVGIHAVVMNGVRIGRNCIVGAGALVTEGKEFPDNSMILGAPARLARPLTPEQLAGLRHASEHYVENAERHRALVRRID